MKMSRRACWENVLKELQRFEFWQSSMTEKMKGFQWTFCFCCVGSLLLSESISSLFRYALVCSPAFAVSENGKTGKRCFPKHQVKLMCGIQGFLNAFNAVPLLWDGVWISVNLGLNFRTKCTVKSRRTFHLIWNLKGKKLHEIWDDKTAQDDPDDTGSFTDSLRRVLTT